MGGRGIGRRLAAALALLATVAVAHGSSAAPAAPGSGAWTVTLPLAQQSRQQLSAMPNGTAYVMDVGSQAITLWHSANFGVTWDPLTYLPGISSFARARFATDKIGYLSDFSALYMTTDGATTASSWKQLPGPRMAKGDSYSLWELGVTGSTVSLGGEVTGPTHLGCNPPKHTDIWTSHDSGRTWVDARLPGYSEVGSIRFANARDGVALAWEMKPDGNYCEYLGSTNSVYVTHDGGRHFVRAARCAAHGGELCTAAMFLDSHRLLVGRNDGTMASSADGGRTFTERPGLPTVAGMQPTKSEQDDWFWIQGFAQAGGTIYATTKFAGAYLSTNSGQTWTRETTCDSAYTLGIGEVAAFDGTRAIAGGPTCLSTRLGTPVGAGSQQLLAASAASGPDTVASAYGVTMSVTDGRVVRVSSPRRAASRAG